MPSIQKSLIALQKVINFSIIYGIFFDKIHMFFVEMIMFCMASCLLVRTVVFKSESSMFISFAIAIVCVIITLDHVGIMPFGVSYGYMMLALAFVSLVVFVIFKRHALFHLFMFLAPIASLCIVYTYGIVGTLTFVILICTHLVVYTLIQLFSKGKTYGKI